MKSTLKSQVSPTSSLIPLTLLYFPVALTLSNIRGMYCVYSLLSFSTHCNVNFMK